MKAKMKSARFKARLDTMLAEGWELQGALGLLLAYGYGDCIAVENESGFLSIKKEEI